MRKIGCPSRSFGPRDHEGVRARQTIPPIVALVAVAVQNIKNRRRAKVINFILPERWILRHLSNANLCP